MQPTTHLRPAIFLDRDGTINRDSGYVHRIEDLELLDGAAAGLRRMAALGMELVIVTNQSGIARGYFTEGDMHAFNRALCRRLSAVGVTIAAVYYCPFHPTAGIGPYCRESTFRKPNCGMFQTAAAERGLDLHASFAVGDQMTDVEAGQAAGCRTILISGAFERRVARGVAPDCIAADLVEAAAFIEREVARQPATRPIPTWHVPATSVSQPRVAT
jgi:D-glycero-D-manno-heptose 1,7-bisphosphate phosphatase